MRQQFFFFALHARRAFVGLLCVVTLALLADPAGAQDASQATETAAERIARLRDLAAQRAELGAEPTPLKTQAASDAVPGQAPVSDGALPAVSDGATQGSEAGGEAELPANEQLLLGGQGGEGGGLSLFNREGPESKSYDGGGGGWVLNTLAALGIVIALVFLIRWALRRGGVVSTAAPRSSVVEVLSRTTVAPRSHVVLMRVGQRILIVSDSPAGMRTLSTVQEPDEVAELLGSIDAAAPASMTSSFQGAMSKLTSQWSDTPAGDAQDDDNLPDEGLGIDRTRGALSSLRDRLSVMAKAGGGA